MTCSSGTDAQAFSLRYLRARRPKRDISRRAPRETSGRRGGAPSESARNSAKKKKKEKKKFRWKTDGWDARYGIKRVDYRALFQVRDVRCGEQWGVRIETVRCGGAASNGLIIRPCFKSEGCVSGVRVETVGCYTTDVRRVSPLR